MKTPVYLILGSTGAGRRSVLLDLVQDGVNREAAITIYIPESEAPIEVEEKIAKRDNVTIERYSGSPKTETEGIDCIFYMVDGKANPVDEIEIFDGWVDAADCELYQVITCVDTKLLQDHPEAQKWYDACIHFSDTVLLGNRVTNNPKWEKDFVQNYKKKERMPALFELIKKGRVQNPPMLMEPLPRRISNLFEEDEDPYDDIDIDIDFEDDGEGDLDEPLEITAKVDPYLERLTTGDRKIKLPDITEYLG